MCKFAPNDDDEQLVDTITVDNYVGSVQEGKRIIASEFIE